MTSTHRRLRPAVLTLLTLALALAPPAASTGDVPLSGATPYPIVFVTQVPIPADYTTTLATFGNHRADPARAGRGGDLWIRYTDGSLKNLTAAAGWGMVGHQGAQAIQVRDPCVHWGGRKVLFSMVVGSPEQYHYDPWHWQLYEIEGLAPNETPVITKVPNQPPFQNVSGCYDPRDRIVFVCDRPRDGQMHLFPQLDEYEEVPTNTGLWRLDPATGELVLLDHSPSGAFDPLLDRYGRVVYSRWDHLQRDQQADSKYMGGNDYGTFNYQSEAPNAPQLPDVEVFPDPRRHWIQFVDAHPNYSGPLRGWTPDTFGHDMNQFFPWTVNPDGTRHETLLHSGRHELGSYFPVSIEGDPNLVAFTGTTAYTRNQNPLRNALQLAEEPGSDGVFLAVDAPEFGTHAAGKIVRFGAKPGLSPDALVVQDVTHPDTAYATDQPSADHTGLYRNPLRLADGTWVTSHTAETREDVNEGTRNDPVSRYDLRLRALVPQGQHWAAGPTLTPGIHEAITYYDPDELVHYDGPLWELDPVELRARPRPPLLGPVLETPERVVLAQEGVTTEELSTYLRQRDLALIVSRNVTARDRNDRQQPFNLRVAGGGVESIATSGKVYDVSFLQLFQGDLVRGLTWGGSVPTDGRRVLAQPMHEPLAANPPVPGSPRGSVRVAADGSTAALVPARRALSWQLTDPEGEPVVRERYWLTFQPGEIRTCASCHGLSSADQLQRSEPQNPPEALRELLQHLKALGEL